MEYFKWFNAHGIQFQCLVYYYYRYEFIKNQEVIFRLRYSPHPLSLYAFSMFSMRLVFSDDLNQLISSQILQPKPFRLGVEYTILIASLRSPTEFTDRRRLRLDFNCISIVKEICRCVSRQYIGVKQWLKSIDKCLWFVYKIGICRTIKVPSFDAKMH